MAPFPDVPFITSLKPDVRDGTFHSYMWSPFYHWSICSWSVNGPLVVPKLCRRLEASQVAAWYGCALNIKRRSRPFLWYLHRHSQVRHQQSFLRIFYTILKLVHQNRHSFNMYSSITLFSIASLLVSIPTAFAGYSSSSQSNVAIYWGALTISPISDIRMNLFKHWCWRFYTGQNSYGQGTGSLAQQRLSYYCASKSTTIVYSIHPELDE